MRRELADGEAVIVGSGIDLIEIERLDQAFARHGSRFATRVFHPAEIATCRRHRRPTPHFAERFAAKEAVMKALGTGWARGVRWVDIEVVEKPNGAAIALHGAVFELARQRGVHRVHLGIGRTRSLAIASVLLEAGGP